MQIQWLLSVIWDRQGYCLIPNVNSSTRVPIWDMSAKSAARYDMMTTGCHQIKSSNPEFPFTNMDLLGTGCYCSVKKILFMNPGRI
jgi:hypothetical protein